MEHSWQLLEEEVQWSLHRFATLSLVYIYIYSIFSILILIAIHFLKVIGRALCWGNLEAVLIERSRVEIQYSGW